MCLLSSFRKQRVLLPPNLDSKFSLNKERRWERGETPMPSERAWFLFLFCHASSCGCGLLFLHTSCVSIRHASAYDSIDMHQQTCAYVSIDTRVTPPAAAAVSCFCIRPHTSAYAIRPHTSAYAARHSRHACCCGCGLLFLYTSAYVSIRPHSCAASASSLAAAFALVLYNIYIYVCIYIYICII